MGFVNLPLRAILMRRNILLPDIKRWGVDQGPVVHLKEVCLSFGEKQVIDHLTLAIPVGKTTVIIGESGSGKSTLIKTMNGLLVPDSGQCHLFGQDTRHCGSSQIIELRKRTGTILQDYALIDSISVYENIAFPIVENTSMPESEVRKLVEESLKPLGLLDAIDKYPYELSGGMKKRVSFARATIHQPELVFFDEPTTGLDPLMIVFVDNIIRDMRKRYDMTSVIISHDIQSIYRLADNVAFLHKGKIIFQGSLDEIQASKDKNIRRFFDSSNKIAKTTTKAEPRAYVSVRNLYKSFAEKPVLKGVSLDIPERKITVIIGGSGSGKSVLLKHILGLFTPDSGTVCVDGLELTQCTERERETMRTHIGMLFQGAALFDSMTVRDNIAFPLAERRNPTPKDEIRFRVDEIMKRLKIDDIAEAWPDSISAGQRKRVGLARAIITKPKLMIYDEPTTGQDPIMIRYVDDMILEAHDEFQLTTIVISHDMVSTFRIADQIAMVYNGVIAAHGSPDELLASPNPEVQKMIRAQIPNTAS